KQPAACYRSVQSRCWRQLNLDKFRTDLFQSLNTEPMKVSQSTDAMLSFFNNTVQSVLDQHVPVRTISRRQRTSDVWFDEECRLRKRHVRKLERCYKRTGCDTDRATWVEALRSMHKFNDVKRSHFWRGRIEYRIAAGPATRDVEIDQPT